MNNIELLKPLIKFENSDEFYLIEIIQRRKDIPNLSKNSILINHYMITSIDGFEHLMPEIITTCDSLNARAYINVSTKSFKKFVHKLNIRIAEIINNGDYKSIKGLFVSACRQTSIKDKNYWVVDVDYDDTINNNTETGIKNFNDLYHFIYDLQSKTGKEPFMYKIPTKNGCHIITKGFNSKKFSDMYPSVSIHKENPTILYIK